MAVWRLRNGVLGRETRRNYSFSYTMPHLLSISQIVPLFSFQAPGLDRLKIAPSDMVSTYSHPASVDRAIADFRRSRRFQLQTQRPQHSVRLAAFFAVDPPPSLALTARLIGRVAGVAKACI